MMESLLAFKRAGADGILTYFAATVAEKLKALDLRRACQVRRGPPCADWLPLILSACRSWADAHG